jgi:sialic acid synthase SpsE/sugar phosphate isomerase/epimerase
MVMYHIAEIGKNSDGNLGRCELLLRAVAQAGADAVRFAHFSLADSVYPDALSSSAERAWSLKLELPFLGEKLFTPEEYRTVLGWCAELSIDFIGTPWDLPSLEMFVDCGVTHYKVNSLNAHHVPLLSRVLQVAERTYLSTGGLSERQVRDLCARVPLADHDVVLMHAVTAYPAPVSVINMRALGVLRRYHPVVGYSSNDLLDTTFPAAQAMGATVLDKHVHLTESDSPAHRGSVSVNRFADMVSALAEFTAVLGRASKQESRGEMANRDVLAKGLVMARDVPAGALIGPGDVALQLPPKGLLSESWYDVVGARASRDLAAGAYLFSSDVSSQAKGNGLPADGQDDVLGERGLLPGTRGVVVRLKDIEEMTAGRDFDYVEVHYAAADLDRPDTCRDYDLDLAVHVPEYASGVLLDLCSYDEAMRRYSIEVINRVMDKARGLKRHFHRCRGDVRFVIHPGALTYPALLDDPSRQYGLFADSMRRLDTSGLHVLVENMTPFAWFIDGDWSPKQGQSNAFMEPRAMADFLGTHGYSMCLDLCHAKLYCTHAGIELSTYMRTVKPYVRHIHFSDCTGIDGEGVQLGDGEIDWSEVCETFADYEHGWTPEIWNGHHDHGSKFCVAHQKLADEFRRYRQAAGLVRESATLST